MEKQNAVEKFKKVVVERGINIESNSYLNTVSTSVNHNNEIDEQIISSLNYMILLATTIDINK